MPSHCTTDGMRIVVISISEFMKYFRDSIFMLSCSTKEAYLQKIALNHYRSIFLCLSIALSAHFFWQSLKAGLIFVWDMPPFNSMYSLYPVEGQLHYFSVQSIGKWFQNALTCILNRYVFTTKLTCL